MTFDELSILPALAQTLEKRDITPLPVQELTIPALLQGQPGLGTVPPRLWGGG